ncbi:TIGR02466 family protein [Hyphomonas sp.]|mgnify:FL=1|uniref:TIGR02466 family protein n=1 Tax=Hyphomonas sp. TaxID=87 RepID=UPI000C97848C|nr:TIGR02466 family protein [Hyphomonas sp.]MAL45693.1 hypothetical protein [Hyphomonas sp.]|tara:strand:+ start:260 stop:892 length:633 start_codon:yes stop_codon:yes gene_type:complete
MKENLKEPIITGIFPTPIYITEIDRGFTKQELNFVKEQKKHCTKNAGNINTTDNYILNRKEFKNIKKFLDKHCKNYLDTVICPKNNIELYITQSWLNYTEADQYHHKHEHPNSVVSGVLYFDSDIEKDKILFTTSQIKQIKPTIDNTKYNLWNSETWFFPVKTGKLIMFPSSTIHSVEIKKGKNTRISLAFNTFYKGTIGSNPELTELIL